MQKTSFLIFLVLSFGLSLSAQVKLTQGEYSIYASILKSIYKENRETYSNKSEFVLLNKTKIDDDLELPSSKKYKNLITDFKRKNMNSAIVERKFPRGAYSETYYLTSQAEVDELFESGRIEVEKLRAKAKLDSSLDSIELPTTGCTPFYQKYPESSGHYSLSRVGFNRQLAMVQIKGDLCWTGFSRTYILKKVNTNWKVITFSGSKWIS